MLLAARMSAFNSIRVSPSGFSLVEVLVVLLIIGLGFSLVSVNVGNNDNRLVIEAKQFANRTALIAEQAVLSNEQWGVDIYRQASDEGEEQYGYRWLTRTHEGQWVLANSDREETDFLLSNGIGLIVELAESSQALEIEEKREIVEQKALLEKKQSIAEQLTEQEKEPDEAIQPALWLLSSGETSAFRLTLFDRENTDSQVVVVADELGRVSVETGEEDDVQ